MRSRTKLPHYKYGLWDGEGSDTEDEGDTHESYGDGQIPLTD